MAISAMRFNFLDRETNVGVKDFTQLVDNSVYTGFTDLTSTALEEIQDTGIMDTMQQSLDDLTDMLQNNEIVDTLKDAMDSAMNAISNMELPDTVKNIFDSLKKLDLKGVKDFLGDMLNVGAKFLCNNLDFLKLFMLGYALNKNILSGLLIALLLSWLDRFCKGFTAQESAMANPLGKLGQVIPNMGTQVTSSSAFGQFSGYYSDFIKASAPLGLTVKMPAMDAIANIKGGDISSVLSNARSSEMSFADRNSLIGNLQSELSSFSPGSIQHSNLLRGIGDLKSLPLISEERRGNALQFENLGDKFGSYIKNLGKVDIPPINLVSLTEAQKGLYNKMVDLKSTSLSNSALQCTPNDSFSDFDFASVLPPVTESESATLLASNTVTDSHRTLDLHPTSEVFLEA